MSDPRFLQDGFAKRLAHAIEECGEFIAAAGKLQRWGPHSVNPLLPADEQQENIDWLESEIVDVQQAMDRLSQAIAEEFAS